MSKRQFSERNPGDAAFAVFIHSRIKDELPEGQEVLPTAEPETTSTRRIFKIGKKVGQTVAELIRPHTHSQE